MSGAWTANRAAVVVSGQRAERGWHPSCSPRGGQSLKFAPERERKRERGAAAETGQQEEGSEQTKAHRQDPGCRVRGGGARSLSRPRPAPARHPSLPTGQQTGKAGRAEGAGACGGDSGVEDLQVSERERPSCRRQVLAPSTKDRLRAPLLPGTAALGGRLLALGGSAAIENGDGLEAPLIQRRGSL